MRCGLGDRRCRALVTAEHPLGVGAAHLLKAYFLGAEAKYDAKRKGAVVDLTVGSGFQKLGTSTEVNQAISILGEPELPPRACPAQTNG